MNGFKRFTAHAVLFALCLAATAPGSAATVRLVALDAGFMPDSVVTGADGTVWASAERIDPCHGEVSCQTERVGIVRPNGVEHRARVTLAGEFYGATPGPGPSIWATDPLTHADIFDLSGKLVAKLGLRRANGSGALSAPFLGPDGRMWFAEGSFGLGGGGIVAVDQNLVRTPIARCRGCFFSGGVTAADGNAWFLDPYLGGFYRVTPQGALTRFDEGTFTLQTMIAGPSGALWGTVPSGIAEYDLTGHLVASFAPRIPVQSGLRAIGGNLVWARFGPSRAGDRLEIVTMSPAGALRVARFDQLGDCNASAQQWFSSGPALGGDGALYVGIGCSERSVPYTGGGRGYVARIAP